MARTVIIFTGATGRDAGKQFQITEMSARAGHAWATRAILALMSSGAEVPDDLETGGMAALAVVGVKALGALPPVVAIPLMDELLNCVQIIMPVAIRKWQDDDFEEIATIFQLQKAVFELHIAPFISGGPLTSASATAETAA